MFEQLLNGNEVCKDGLQGGYWITTVRKLNASHIQPLVVVTTRSKPPANSSM